MSLSHVLDVLFEKGRQADTGGKSKNKEKLKNQSVIALGDPCPEALVKCRHKITQNDNMGDYTIGLRYLKP